MAGEHERSNCRMALGEVNLNPILIPYKCLTEMVTDLQIRDLRLRESGGYAKVTW